jgi:hypothetical protein
MVAPVHNLDPTILPEGSVQLQWGGGGTEFDIFYLFLGSSEAAMGVAMSPKRRVRAAHPAREAKTH